MTSQACQHLQYKILLRGRSFRLLPTSVLFAMLCYLALLKAGALLKKFKLFTLTNWRKYILRYSGSPIFWGLPITNDFTEPAFAQKCWYFEV